MTVLGSRQRFRHRLLVAFAVVMLVAYVRQLSASPILGQDFRVFFAAATVVAHGGNPYDWPSLNWQEDVLYNVPEHLTPSDRDFYYFLAYPEGPWLAFALIPLTGRPWHEAYAIFAAVSGLAIAAGAWLTFNLLRWPARRSAIAAACVLLSPIGFINVFMGQVSGLVFFALIVGWALAVRGRATLAGIALTVGWVKPNIGLPLAVVVALAEPAAAAGLLRSFTAGSAAAFAFAFAVLGRGLAGWPLEIPRFWQVLHGPQPDIASVHSFYSPALHGGPATVTLAVVILTLGIYAAWALRSAREPGIRGFTLLLLWLVALPFVQSYDMVLLLPVLAGLLGPDLEGWSDTRVELATWAFMIFPLWYFLGFRIGFFNGFTAIPVLLLAVAWHGRALQPRTPAAASLAA